MKVNPSAKLNPAAANTWGGSLSVPFVCVNGRMRGPLERVAESSLKFEV